MKFFSNFLHKTPWWLLVGAGFFGLAALVIFVTPFSLIRLEHGGTTAEEKRAIKREIDYAFSEGAIDVARGIVRELKVHSKDPQRRAELEQALNEIDQARADLREAGRDVMRAKREAAQNVADAVREAALAITNAQHDAARALREAGVESDKVNKALVEAEKAAHEAEKDARAEAERKGSERIAEAQRRYDEAKARADEQRRIILGKSDKPKSGINIDLDDDRVQVDPPSLGVPPMAALPSVPSVQPPPLPPEVRADIHEKVATDLRRIGLGAGLILLFIPIFIITVIAKIFIDRSRASLKVADEKRREAEYHRMSQQVTEAKLQALQAQVEPHFLYNTLASVQALTEVDPARANTLTGHLIMYLRNALPKMRESVSTVAQEIELVRSYLNILKMRMGNRLTFEIDVPAELENAPFPPLMLPTLVENAIKHGLEPLREGGTIVVKAEERDGTLRLSVADTGKGFGQSESVGGSGVGLANIRERLAALYGDKGKLTLEENQPRGVISVIEVPRDGARIGGAAPLDPIIPPRPPEPPKSAAGKTFAAIKTGERMWRKGLSFTYVALVAILAVICGLAIVAVLTGLLPVHIGGDTLDGPTGALIGTAGILLAFVCIAIALAIVVAVFYGLGFLAVGIAIFIPLVIVVSLVPALAPFILVGLLVWWLIRRNDRKAAERRAAADAAREPTLESTNHADGNPR
jgi:signal transduction histidine kinase